MEMIMSKASYISSVSLERANRTKPLADGVLHQIAAWILRRALRQAEVALRNDRVLRKHYGEFLPDASEDLCVLFGLKIALSSDPSSQESTRC
jgi:hypothetical protein